MVIVISIELWSKRGGEGQGRSEAWADFGRARTTFLVAAGQAAFLRSRRRREIPQQFTDDRRYRTEREKKPRSGNRWTRRVRWKTSPERCWFISAACVHSQGQLTFYATRARRNIMYCVTWYVSWHTVVRKRAERSSGPTRRQLLPGDASRNRRPCTRPLTGGGGTRLETGRTLLTTRRDDVFCFDDKL